MEKYDIEEARRIIERDLTWHQETERKLARAGIAKEDMSDFVNDAIDEKIAKLIGGEG